MNNNMTTSTHWRKLANPDYYGSHDLINPDGTFREIIVTIDKVTSKEIVGEGGKKNQKNILHTLETKPIILNNVNQKVIARLAGSPFVEKWSGVRIIVYVDKVKAFGETTDCLRIRTTKPTPDKPKDYSKQMEAIQNCPDMPALVALWTGFDGETKNACLTAKDAKKSQLETTK